MGWLIYIYFYLFLFVLAAAVSVGLKQGKTVIVVKVSNGAKIVILLDFFTNYVHLACDLIKVLTLQQVVVFIA